MFRYYFLILLLVAGPMSAQQQEDPILKLYISAREDLAARKFTVAEEKLNDALSMVIKRFGAEHPNTALINYELGEVYYTRAEKGDYDKAARLYRQVIEVREKKLGAENPSTINAVDRLGEIYSEQRKLAEAEPLLLRSLKAREKTLQEDHYLINRSYQNLATLYSNTEEVQKAELFYRKSVAFNEKHRGKDSMPTAVSLTILSTHLMRQGNWKEAEVAIRRALVIGEAESKKRPINLGVPLNNIAYLLMSTGRYSEAETMFKNALDASVRLRGEDDTQTANAKSSLGELYRRTGRFDLAEDFTKWALAIRVKRLGETAPDTQQSLHDLGLIQRGRGEVAKAEANLTKSLKMAEDFYGPNDLHVASIQSDLGTLYSQSGQYEKAEKLHNQALAIRERVYGTVKAPVAASLTNLADIAAKRENYDQAEKLYLRSIDILEKCCGPDVLQLTAPLNNLGILRLKAKNRLEVELFLRAYKIIEKNFGPDHVDANRFRGNIGFGYFRAQKYSDAEPFMADSVRFLNKHLGANHPDTIVAKLNLARNRAALDRHEETRELMDEVRRGSRQYLTSVLPSLPEEIQRQFLADTDEFSLNIALSLALANPKTRAFANASAEWLANGKATLLEVKAFSTQLANTHSSPTANQLKKVRTELTQLSISGTGADDVQTAKRRETLAETARKLEAELRSAGGNLGEPLPYVELAAIRKTLGARSALIDIARFDVANLKPAVGQKHSYPPRYVAWITRTTGDVQIVDLGLAEELDRLIATARTELTTAAKTIRTEGEPSAEKQTRAALLAVSKTVLHPLLKHLEGVDELIVSPDGPLWLVPWAAMPLPDEKYLVEAFTLRLVTSGRDLVSTPSPDKPSAPVVVADPDYDLDGADASTELKRLLGNQLPDRTDTRSLHSSLKLGNATRLPGTATEAEAVTPIITKWLGTKPHVYMEKIALKSVVKTVKGPEVLMMSTHGFFKPDQRVEANALAGLSGASKPELKVVGGQAYQDPLTRCGLLFASFNTQKSATGPVADDGLLTGLEVVGCDLRGTKLVVLSACETGLGDVQNGQGVAGLRQAFQLAGAESVVATLWQIPDVQSAQLMVAFFDNLAAKQPRGEALQKAQREMIEKRRKQFGAAHPYYWAAYTLTGQSK